MKLYLSSYRMGNRTDDLSAMVGTNRRTAVIMNATDHLPRERHQQYFEREAAALSRLGFEPEELDLRNYFRSQAALESGLAKYGLLWVTGGNTFLLRRAFRQSGFDSAASSLLGSGQLVYGGYSAGICVITPTLRGLEAVDDPNETADGYEREVIWNGLGLVPYLIVPHYKSDHPESKAADEVVSHHKKHGLSYEALHDGDVIVVD